MRADSHNNRSGHDFNGGHDFKADTKAEDDLRSRTLYDLGSNDYDSNKDSGYDLDILGGDASRNTFHHSYDFTQHSTTSSLLGESQFQCGVYDS